MSSANKLLLIWNLKLTETRKESREKLKISTICIKSSLKRKAKERALTGGESNLENCENKNIR